MRQFVYFSTAAGPQDARVTGDILAVSRERNLAGSISGLLIAGGHRYLQVIEGPTNAVGALVARINRDRRHLSLMVLVDRKVGRRSFDGWAMAFEDEPDLRGFATFPQLVDQMRDAVVDQALHEQIDCFARSFAIAPVQRPSPWTTVQQYVSCLTFDGGH